MSEATKMAGAGCTDVTTDARHLFILFMRLFELKSLRSLPLSWALYSGSLLAIGTPKRALDVFASFFTNLPLQ